MRPNRGDPGRALQARADRVAGASSDAGMAWTGVARATASAPRLRRGRWGLHPCWEEEGGAGVAHERSPPHRLPPLPNHAGVADDAHGCAGVRGP